MSFKLIFSVMLFVTTLSTELFAQGAYQCRRINEASLSELKLKLMENCDLDRPYAFTALSNPMRTDYVICCHTKGQSSQAPASKEMSKK